MLLQQGGRVEAGWLLVVLGAFVLLATEPGAKWAMAAVDKASAAAPQWLGLSSFSSSLSSEASPSQDSTKVAISIEEQRVQGILMGS